MAGLFAGGAGQLPIRWQLHVPLHPIAHREKVFLLRFSHPHIDLRRVRLRCGTDGVIQQICQHGDHIHPAQGEIPQVTKVKIHAYALPGGFLVLASQDGVQQRVVGVHNGGAGRHGLIHTGNIVLRTGHISLCQQGTQRTDMVGEFVGQAALGGVGIQQSRSPLLLQFGLKMQAAPLHDLIVEHSHDTQMHHDGHCETHCHPHCGHGGPFVVICEHEQDVQHHDHARKKAHGQRLQRLQRIVSAPFAHKERYPGADYQICE